MAVFKVVISQKLETRATLELEIDPMDATRSEYVKAAVRQHLLHHSDEVTWKAYSVDGPRVEFWQEKK